MIYLLTEIGLSPGGSTHLHTNNKQNNTNNNRTTQIQANVELYINIKKKFDILLHLFGFFLYKSLGSCL
jgi:hypothetical protein